VKHLIRNLDAEESARELEAAAAGMRVLIWCNSMSSASLTRDAAKKQGKLEYQVAAADGWNAETEAVLCAFLKRQIPFCLQFYKSTATNPFSRTYWYRMRCDQQQVLHLIRSLDAEEAKNA
jgi:hypothetical protein